MVKIIYAYKNISFFLEREREKHKSFISSILLFISEIGRHELQTL